MAGVQLLLLLSLSLLSIPFVIYIHKANSTLISEKD